MAVVYLVTHRETGRSYVGLTTRAAGRRWKDHVGHAKTDSPTYFARALAKYGRDAFDWRVVWDGPELQMKRVEQQLIRAGLGHFNLTAGGDGLSGLKHKESTKQKMSNSAVVRGQQPPPMVGTQAARKVHTGAKRPQIWRQRMSQSQRPVECRQMSDEAWQQFRKEEQRRKANEYYWANRGSVLAKKEAQRRAAWITEKKPAGVPWQ